MFLQVPVVVGGMVVKVVFVEVVGLMVVLVAEVIEVVFGFAVERVIKVI